MVDQGGEAAARWEGAVDARALVQVEEVMLIDPRIASDCLRLLPRRAAVQANVLPLLEHDRRHARAVRLRHWRSHKQAAHLCQAAAH
jgi:hypothetical protein